MTGTDCGYWERHRGVGSGVGGTKDHQGIDITSGGTLWPGQTSSRAFINQRVDYSKNFGLPEELSRVHAMLLARRQVLHHTTVYHSNCNMSNCNWNSWKFLMQKFAKQLAKCICQCKIWTNFVVISFAVARQLQWRCAEWRLVYKISTKLLCTEN